MAFVKLRSWFLLTMPKNIEIYFITHYILQCLNHIESYETLKQSNQTIKESDQHENVQQFMLNISKHEPNSMRIVIHSETLRQNTSVLIIFQNLLQMLIHFRYVCCMNVYQCGAKQHYMLWQHQWLGMSTCPMEHITFQIYQEANMLCVERQWRVDLSIKVTALK